MVLPMPGSSAFVVGICASSRSFVSGVMKVIRSGGMPIPRRPSTAWSAAARDRKMPTTASMLLLPTALRYEEHRPIRDASRSRLPVAGRQLGLPVYWRDMSDRIGLIAGNGRFPLLVLDAARARGLDVVVAAIKEETFPEIESHGAASVHWLSLGELSRLIDTFRREGVSRAVMAGQVKHKQIFSSIRPDWRLAKLLLSLPTRNTDSLIGAVAKVLADEGITLITSTSLLEPLLARPGVLTRRAPGDDERRDLEYGRAVGRHLAQYDVGQTVVVAGAACVAVEAMEGTDATIERAGHLMSALEGSPS